MGPSLWIHLWLLPLLVADVVAIESEPADPELAQIAVESCSDTLGQGRCRAASEPGAAATWFVRVIWQPPERLRARVEIRRDSDQGTPSSVRVVEFSPADDLAQRHRAIGLIVAAYVIEQTPRAPPPAPPPPLPSPAPAPPPADEPETESEAPVAPRRAPAWSVDLALLAAPGLDRGAPRFGAMLRGLARPFDVPLSGLLALRLARRGGNPELLWIGGSAGLALRVPTPLPALAFELRAAFALERLHADARDAESGQEPDLRGLDPVEGGVFRYGAQLGLEVHVALGSRFGLFAGAELTALVPPVYLYVGGDGAGQDRSLGWGGLAGVRLMD